MDSGAAQSDKFYDFLAWLEVNKQRVLWGAAIVAVLGLVIFVIVWNRGQREDLANEALFAIKATSNPTAPTPPGLAESYLKVAESHAGTQAGGRARLLGAATLYTQNDYSRALEQFQRYLRDAPDGAWGPQASLGVAVCLDSLKRSKEAAAKYDEIIKRFPNEPEAIRARMQLARLHEEDGKPDLALKLYEEVARTDRASSQGSMALLRAEDLRTKYPALTMTNVMSVVKTNLAPLAATNAPGSLPTNLQALAVTNLSPATNLPSAPNAPPATAPKPANP